MACKLYEASNSEIILNHQRAHLIPDPKLEDLSDTGLPNEEELGKRMNGIASQLENSSMTPADMLRTLRLLKLKNKAESSQDNRVIITWVYNPTHFFVRHANFDRQLEQIECELGKYAEEIKVLHSSTAFDMVEGRICIGRQLVEAPQIDEIGMAAPKTDAGKDFFEYKRVQILRIATKGKIPGYVPE